MSPETLIEAIKAADLGPFREVRLITLVHQKGVTPAVREQVIKEIHEVNEQERASNQHLKAYIKELETCLRDLEKLEAVAERLEAVKRRSNV